LTFRDLVPGHHRLLVALVSHPSIRATVSFTVIGQPPPPVQVTAPPPQVTAPPPAPAPVPNSGIPQGPNAGDADSDNHGGPSDGDGNI
jgi:hypothetical protein